MRRALHWRDEATTGLGALTNEVLGELWRRAEQGPSGDGYASASLRFDVRSQAELTSVEASANGHLHGRGERDPVLEAITDVVDALAEVRRLIAGATKRTAAVMATAERKRGRWSAVGTCAACDRVVTGTPGDVLRSGYCSSCATAFYRWRSKVGDGDHRRFEEERRAHLDLPPRRGGRGDQAIRDTDSPYVR